MSMTKEQFINLVFVTQVRRVIKTTKLTAGKVTIKGKDGNGRINKTIVLKQEVAATGISTTMSTPDRREEITVTPRKIIVKGDDFTEEREGSELLYNHLTMDGSLHYSLIESALNREKKEVAPLVFEICCADSVLSDLAPFLKALVKGDLMKVITWKVIPVDNIAVEGSGSVRFDAGKLSYSVFFIGRIVIDDIEIEEFKMEFEFFKFRLPEDTSLSSLPLLQSQAC